MIEMVRRFLRQRFASPAMAIALAVIALLTAVQAALSDPERALGSGFLAIVLIGAGSVSKDASGGALQMILARPIRRSSYLFGRYLGILAAYAVFLLVAGGLTVLFSSTLPGLFGATARPVFSAPALGRGAAAALLDALLFAAILLFFSTFLRGYADVLAYILLSILLQLLAGLGSALREPWLGDAGEAIRKNVLPKVDWNEVLRGQNVLGEPTGRYVLAVTVFLLLAAVVFSRREFAYGHD
jgi:ABC-type transport system involved in multi-copper enzyme maturation permease subunit